ncbi:MAG: C39 family peptidase [Defluviitaleaceae bacterium]|nr:C39 family peptidase [Defluviitaleaceae bacterium]
MRKTKSLLLITCIVILFSAFKNYDVYVDNNFFDSYDNYKDALFYAKMKKNSYIYDNIEKKFFFQNDKKFAVDNLEFSTFKESVDYLESSNINSDINYLPTNSILYSKNKTEKNKIDLVQIYQMPNFPRGCSVTSLTMLLNHAGISVTKEEVYEKIRLNDRKEEIINGVIHFGNPYNGFVGDIYTFKNAGLGVYYPPILEVLEEYIGDRALNLTDVDFEYLLYHLDKGFPIWVIVNAKYKYLDNNLWISWQTEDGEIKITKWMHSVVLTGHDDEYVYFCDPLGKQTKANIKDFESAWVQMGRQALSYVN